MKISDEKLLAMKQNYYVQKKEYEKLPTIGNRSQIQRPGKEAVDVIIYAPEEKGEKHRAFLQVHGGGWIALDAVLDDEYCARISRELSAYVVNINYKKLIEQPFPYQQEEVVDVVKWIIKNAEELNIDTNRIIISGGSAGGHITAGAAMLLEKNNITIAGQLLEVPALDFTNSSGEDFGEFTGMFQQLHDEFFPELPLTHEIVSPVVAPDETLRKLVPSVIIVCGRDPLHVQGEVYARRLKALGVDTVLKMYENGTHGFNTNPEYSEELIQEQEELKEDCFQFKKVMLVKLWDKALRGDCYDGN